MTKIDIFSGFLGAGKTTLIKKLIQESFAGQQIVLIENEFGEIGIDGGFLQQSGIRINELNAGCICCSLVGDFRTALQQVVEQYHPDRILIEPSGVGKLSDVTRAVEGVSEHLDVELNSFVTVADVNKVKLYMKNFGEFYDDQVSHASCILLSRTQTAPEDKVAAAPRLRTGLAALRRDAGRRMRRCRHLHDRRHQERHAVRRSHRDPQRRRRPRIPLRHEAERRRMRQRKASGRAIRRALRRHGRTGRRRRG